MTAIRFDYTNVLNTVVGEHGLSEDELFGMADASEAALKSVLSRRTKDLRWLDLPYTDDVVADVLSYASSVAGKYKNVVVCGIGGSALGITALQSALNSPFHDMAPPEGMPRLFVLDNIDPDWIGEFLEQVDPAETLFNVISKSGGTAETMSQFLIVREKLIEKIGHAEHVEHICITTDEKNGVLRKIVEREGYHSFIVPEGVGGRFSVLSPVGLVACALVGIDIRGLMRGAADMDERCKDAPFAENPALLHAAIQYQLHETKGKPLAVMFSYSHRLRNVADWYAQLLAESIGKRKGRNGEDVYRGPTPIRAVGVTDQHSQVQLYTEGPFDKWFTMLAVDGADHTVTIPLAFEDDEGVSYLGKRTLNELFDAEREGTRIALNDANRPNAVLSLEKVDAHSVGQLLFMLELSVAVMGEHYDIDAFNQPGVEAGKVAAYALMGRAGYEERRAEIEAGSVGKPRVV